MACPPKSVQALVVAATLVTGCVSNPIVVDSSADSEDTGSTGDGGPTTVTSTSPDDTTGAVGTSTTGSMTSSSTEPPTTTTTVDPTIDPTDATTDGTDTTSSGGDTDTGTTGGSSTSDGGSTDGGVQCIPECLPGQACIAGLCFGDPSSTGAMCNDSPGNYDSCLLPDGSADDTLCGPDPAICIVDGAGDWGVCSVDCVDVCDCPQAPPGAVAACDELTGPGAGNCFLDCSGGAGCPVDYSCFAGLLCIPFIAPPPVPLYGDCVNSDQMCDGGVCVLDNAMAPTLGVCIAQCIDVGDCPDPGGGFSAECIPVIPGPSSCVIDCMPGGVCPNGMDCFQDDFCVWPVI